MTQASQDIAKQFANAAVNKKNWGAIAYNVLSEGLSGDGVSDDTAKLQALINKAIAAGRRTILFPHGQYYVTALTGADQVDFVGDNSSFVGGYTGTISDLAGFSALQADNPLYITDFGADRTGVADSTAALQAARDHLASLTYQRRLVFPSGIYRFSVSPNWAIQDAQIVAEGEVRLRYEGIGNAVILDGGATGGGIYNTKFLGTFVVEAPATALNAVYSRAMHHCKIEAKVLGCGSLYAGLYAEWNVCTEFVIVVSGNEEGVWYTGAKPKYGVHLTCRQSYEPTSYCTFINPILEGIDKGSYLVSAMGNLFVGGTMEACQTFGSELTNDAVNNKFVGVDFEVNGNADYYCNGSGNEFISCDSYTVIVLEGGSKNNSIIGGNYSGILTVAGATDNLISGINYNRFGDGKTITDNGTRTRRRDNYNVGLVRRENSPPARTQLTVTASPFTHVNNTANDEDVLVSGGTVSQIVFIYNGFGDILPNAIGPIRLSPGNSVQVTYSAAPDVVVYAR